MSTDYSSAFVSPDRVVYRDHRSCLGAVSDETWTYDRVTGAWRGWCAFRATGVPLSQEEWELTDDQKRAFVVAAGGVDTISPEGGMAEVVARHDAANAKRSALLDEQDRMYQAAIAAWSPDSGEPRPIPPL